jgi:alginate O-acetyltransferase complex protein AlgI
VGLTIFALGLFKKVVLADGVAPYATPVFTAAQRGVELGLLQSWGGALAYTMQLYFDFSGYCDMAIGLSYAFGVKLPINFNSPYKSTNIAEFWRRWHMTLSRFLRDYLYIALGGNRHGTARRYTNLIITMVLGGLWHGAGWTFVVWGALHGFYLVVHQGWRWLCARMGQDLDAPSSRGGRVLGTAFTFIAVVFAWVFFRAHDLDSALLLVKGLCGQSGVSLPEAYAFRLGSFANTLSAAGVTFVPGGGRDLVMTYLWLLALLPVVFLAPNTQEIMQRVQPALGAPQAGDDSAKLAWRPSQVWGLVMSLVLALGLLSLTRPSEFLYFQF